MEIKKMNIILGVIALIITMFCCFYFRIVQPKIKENRFNKAMKEIEGEFEKSFNMALNGVDHEYEMVYNETTNTLEVKVRYDFITKENSEVVDSMMSNLNQSKDILKKFAENINYPLVDYVAEVCLENKLKDGIHLQISHYIGSTKILTTIDKEVLWSIVSL